jgi:hypothetical protein
MTTNLKYSNHITISKWYDTKKTASLHEERNLAMPPDHEVLVMIMTTPTTPLLATPSKPSAGT